MAGVVVTDGITVVATDEAGNYALPGVAGPRVFVVTPGGQRMVGSWYRATAARVDFPLAAAALPTRWRFAHLSDVHVDATMAPRFREALKDAVGRAADFALVSGDLVLDALRADEATARARYAAYDQVAAQSPLPVRPAIGNHDVFGIDRRWSRATAGESGYGKALYEEREGPRYSAFNRGRVHFIVLDTVGLDDTRYYGVLDDAQLEWIRRELRYVPAGTTVVTVGHIPLRSGALALSYAAEGLARSLLNVGGRTSYPHVVRNADALAEILAPYRWTLALQGHTHVAERLAAETGGHTRYHTAPAVNGPRGEPAAFFLYAVEGSEVDDGEIVLLDDQGAGE
jgi:3',5'-cyclic AMP phosphodiesterase CpdA